MPKQQLVLNQFEGGLMEYHNARDIPENALSKADNVMVDKLGQIRLMGRQRPHPTIGNPSNNGFENLITANVTPGYGLHGFGGDYGINLNSGTVLVAIADPSGGSSTITSAEHNLSAGDRVYIEGSTFYGEYVVQTVPTDDTFTILNTATPGAAERFYWYRVTDDNNPSYFYATQDVRRLHIIDGYQVKNRITLGSDEDDVRPAFYNTNDALRVTDSNYANTNNASKWYGYIPERTQFVGHTETLGSSYWEEHTTGTYSGGTLSSASATGFDMDVGSGQQIVNTEDSTAGIELQDGVTIKLTFDLTLQDSKTINPVVYLTESQNQLPSNSVSELSLIHI